MGSHACAAHSINGRVDWKWTGRRRWSRRCCREAGARTHIDRSWSRFTLMLLAENGTRQARTPLVILIPWVLRLLCGGRSCRRRASELTGLAGPASTLVLTLPTAAGSRALLEGCPIGASTFWVRTSCSVAWGARVLLGDLVSVHLSSAHACPASPILDPLSFAMFIGTGRGLHWSRSTVFLPSDATKHCSCMTAGHQLAAATPNSLSRRKCCERGGRCLLRSNKPKIPAGNKNENRIKNKMFKACFASLPQKKTAS